MTRRRRNSNASIQGLARLLAMATRIRSRRPDGDAARFDALQEVLAGPADRGTIARNRRATAAAVLTDRLLSGGSRSVGLLLKDKRTSLQALERIKELGKRLSSTGRRRADRAAGVAVYYAAIAAAEVHRGRKISSLPPARLRLGFRRLKDRPWMDLTLAVLFERAGAGKRQVPLKSRKRKART